MRVGEPNLGWEPLWRKYGQHFELQDPQPEVVQLVRLLRDSARPSRRRVRVHDLGCGLGRHLLLLAAAGFRASGSDVSPAAVETCQRRLRQAGLRATVTRSDMTSIPEPESSLDAVVAWDVVYHATVADMLKTIGGVRDRLKEGGYFLATFISTADGDYARSRELLAQGEAVELEPDTFQVPGDDITDKSLPHHYSTEAEVRERFLDGFEVVWLREERVEGTDREGRPHPNVHWHVLARKK
jgi:tellurite methyltransferase